MNKFLILKREINLLRRFRYWSKEKCIFIHVPKGAGTSINRALYGRTLGHYTAKEVSCRFPRLYEESFTFSFVRNPWDRILSAYAFAKRGRTESMGVHKPEQYKISEFESFERFLMEWLPRQNLRDVDFIFRPQCEFLCDDCGDVMVDFVGKVENLKTDISEVSKKINKEILVGRANSTRGGGQGYREFYTSDDMIAMVEKVYESDIRCFGYKFS